VVLLAVGAGYCGWIVLWRATPERLVRSAAGGDIAWVERCLHRGVDVDARYEALLGFGGSHSLAATTDDKSSLNSCGTRSSQDPERRPRGAVAPLDRIWSAPASEDPPSTRVRQHSE